MQNLKDIKKSLSCSLFSEDIGKHLKNEKEKEYSLMIKGSIVFRSPNGVDTNSSILNVRNNRCVIIYWINWMCPKEVNFIEYFLLTPCNLWHRLSIGRRV